MSSPEFPAALKEVLKEVTKSHRISTPLRTCRLPKFSLPAAQTGPAPDLNHLGTREATCTLDESREYRGM